MSLSSKSNFWIVIPAAGKGTRFQQSLPKQYTLIEEKTILEHTVKIFLNLPWVKQIIIAIASDDPYFSQLPWIHHPKIKAILGGETRTHSVIQATTYLKQVANDHDWVLVQDAVRPCLHEADLHRLKNDLMSDKVGGILAAPIHDTLKLINEQGTIKTLDREKIWCALTPQMFRLSLLHEALIYCFEKNVPITDEANALEACGYPIKLVPAHYPNPKLTQASDLSYLKHLLTQKGGILPMIRIGHGYDIHKFEAVATKKQVTLGGVTIPCDKGLVAHSDGDVVIHAVCDALLGACALGDIGQHFPDTDPQFKNCDSRVLLRDVIQKIQLQHYIVGNVDVTIIAQTPKISPHSLEMRKNLAADLRVNENDINIKATTNEGLDAIGQKQGIAVHAVALLIRTNAYENIDQ